MRSFIPIVIILLLFTACSTESSLNEPSRRSVVTEELLSQYSSGTRLDKLIEELNLKEFNFDPQPNQVFGHEQGWYRLPEGDLMVSATLNEGGVMLLDSTPWILKNSEQ